MPIENSVRGRDSFRLFYRTHQHRYSVDAWL